MNTIHQHLKIARYLSYLLDSRFGVGRFRFGLDPILGLIPGFGDVFTTVFSFYIVWIAIQTNVPSHVIGQMIRNIIFDLIIGLIPFFGDIADFAYRASSKNFRLLEKHLPAHYAGNVIDVR